MHEGRQEPRRRRVLARLGSSWLALVLFALLVATPTVMLAAAVTAAFAPPPGVDPPPAAGRTAPPEPTPPPGSPGTPRADLVATVRSDPPAPQPGRPITYVAGVTSRGPAPTTFSALVLTLPPGTQVRATRAAGDVRCAAAGTRLTCTGPGLTPGASREVTVTALVPATSGRGDAAATVAVSSDLADPTPADTVATTTAREQRVADLVVVSPPPPGPVVPGTRVTVGATLTNRGPSLAESTVLTTVLPPGTTFVSGSVPGGTCGAVGGEVTCSVPRPLVPGEAVTTAVVVAVDPAFDAPDLLVPTSAVSGTPDPRPADDAVVARAPVTARAALDAVTQAATVVGAGSPTTYSVVVTNRGPSDARDVALTTGNDAMVPVDVDASVGRCDGEGALRRCTLGTLPSGASTRGRVGATGPPDAAAGPAPVTTRLTSATPRAAVAAPPVPPAVMAVARPADLAVAIDTARSGGLGGATGTAAAYTVTARNLGPSVSAPAVLSAIIPDGLTIGPVSASCTVAVRQVSCPVPALPVGGATSAVVNTGLAPGLLVTPEPVQARVATVPRPGAVTTVSTDPQPGNDTAIAAVGDTDGADLAVTAATGPGPVVAGARTVRTVTVRNRGPAAAAGVVVADNPGPGMTPVDVPPGCTVAPGTVSCPVGGLGVGEARVVRIPVDVAVNAPTGAVSGTATARPAALVDPSDSNATTATLTPVGTSADLRTVLERVDPGPLVAGGPPVTYRVRTTNVGPSVAAAAVLDLDALPRGLTVVGASVGGAPCVFGPSRAVCAVGDLAPTAVAEALVGVAVAGDLPPAGPPPAVTARASSMAVDPTPDDAGALLAEPVTGTADLRARIDPDPLTTPYGTVAAGSRLGLRVSVVDTGPAQAAATAFSTTLPAGTTVVSAVPNRGRCTVTGVRIDCLPGDLAAGGTATVTVVVDVPPEATGVFEARTTALSPTVDPTPADRVAVLALPLGDADAPSALPPGTVPPGAPGTGPVALLARTLSSVTSGAVGAAGALVLVAVAGLLTAMRERRQEAAAARDSSMPTERIEVGPPQE